jgi:hypothetical protein
MPRPLGYVPAEIEVGKKVVVSATNSVAVANSKGEKIFLPRWALPNPKAGAGDIVEFIRMGLKKAYDWGILPDLKE